jgi:hypothetical protein
MKATCLTLLFICLCSLITINIPGTHAQNVPSDEISISIPRNVVTHAIKSILPLNLENGPYLEGSLWIHSIDHLKIDSNRVEFDMTLRGKNIRLETHLGNQPILMDIGDFNADFSCNASMRYDKPKRVLYITPYLLRKPNKNEENKIAANLLQLLSLANGAEYPIEIQKFQPLLTQIGRDQFNIDMEITNITTQNNALFISGQPLLKKISPPPLSEKKSQ